MKACCDCVFCILFSTISLNSLYLSRFAQFWVMIFRTPHWWKVTHHLFWQHLKRNDKSPEFHGLADLEVPQSFCCNFFYSETFVHQELSNKLQEKLFNERDLCIKGTIIVFEKWAWCLTVHIGNIQVYFHTLTLPLIVSPRQIISWAKKT